MTDKDKLTRIREHLGKLHSAWNKDGGGHCKSSEGAIELRLCYPNWFEAGCDVGTYVAAEPKVRVGVYSYLFGPHRMHDFDSLDEALTAVLSWEYK